MSRKFELRLAVSAKNKKFAELCHDALFNGGTVVYKRKQHRVYHYSKYENIHVSGNVYIIGLVPVDEK